MSKARDLADFQGSASALTTGTLPVDRVPYVGRRNMIINGGFDVWQRGTSGTNGFVADRFTQGSVTSTTKVSSTLGGFGSAMRVVTVASDPVLAQQIENTEGRLAGQTMTLSFWMKSDISDPFSPSQYCEWYDGSNNYNVLVVGVPAVIETNGDWKRYSRTFTLPSNAIGAKFNARIDFNEYTVQTLDITGVQLELGSVATPFEHRSYGEELALCQRYYQVGTYYAQGYQLVNQDYSIHIVHPVEMRANPSRYLGTQNFFANCATHTFTGTPSGDGKSSSRAYSRAVSTSLIEFGYDYMMDAEL